MDADATLLVIDDEPDVLAIVDRFAQRFGFKVVSRTDARTALAELPALKPDAVIVDPGLCRSGQLAVISSNNLSQGG